MAKIADSEDEQGGQRYHEGLKVVGDQTEQDHRRQGQRFAFPTQTLVVELADPFGLRVDQIESFQVVHEDGALETGRFSGHFGVLRPDGLDTCPDDIVLEPEVEQQSSSGRRAQVFVLQQKPSTLILNFQQRNADATQKLDLFVAVLVVQRDGEHFVNVEYFEEKTPIVDGIQVTIDGLGANSMVAQLELNERIAFAAKVHGQQVFGPMYDHFQHADRFHVLERLQQTKVGQRANGGQLFLVAFVRRSNAGNGQEKQELARRRPILLVQQRDVHFVCFVLRDGVQVDDRMTQTFVVLVIEDMNFE